MLHPKMLWSQEPKVNLPIVLADHPFLTAKPTPIAYNRSRYEMLKIGCFRLGVVNVVGVIQC